MTMRHTDEEIQEAAERFERVAEELDPETAEVVSTDDLRGVALAAEAVRDDEARLPGGGRGGAGARPLVEPDRCGTWGHSSGCPAALLGQGADLTPTDAGSFRTARRLTPF